MDGYYPKVMEEIYDWEREEVEDIIWDAFFNKNEIELAQFFPKLKKYDGIKALKESPYLLQIPSEASVEIGKILYEATGDDGYLDIIKKNIDASPETISFVSILSYCKPCNGVQREHNKKLNNGLPILHKVPPKRDYGRYFCIMAEKGGTSHGGLTEKLSLFFHAKKQEVNAYGR